MKADPWSLYTLMLGSRMFEEAVTRLWNDGMISGEMHLGTGEEAVCAGVVTHLRDGDAMALDHRGTPPLLMRGVDGVALLRELLGRPGGLCGGRGGHMHLFSRAHLAASSGIVGAAGPAAVGFALAGQRLRPGSIAVAFFGEGALNQGMLMESLNLAAAWKLPVLFVCKDDGWSIATGSAKVTGGSPPERARGFGLPVVEADGLEVERVWESAGAAIAGIRAGGGPVFLHARCTHLEGHFLGFQLLRALRDPLKEMPAVAGPVVGSLLRPGGASVAQRLAGVREVMAALRDVLRDPARKPETDPLARARTLLAPDAPRLESLEARIEAEVSAMVTSALGEEAA
jgi:acetoin:2,6-dichlorophenolindophenol oxidoreductase subunit alpha